MVSHVEDPMARHHTTTYVLAVVYLWPCAQGPRLDPTSVTVRIATIPALWLPCEHPVLH